MPHDAKLVSKPDPDVPEVAELRASLAAERAARLRAEAADAAKDSFLARLGHEWRTPLSAISAAADVLDGVSSSDPLAREARDVIRRQALKLAARIDSVLDATRVIAGRAVLSRGRVDLAGLAAQAVEASQAAGLADHCELRLTRCEAPVDVDPARVSQAVLQLLANALRFTPAGGEVEVEVGEDAAGAFLRVTDAGPGMTPDAVAGQAAESGLGLRFVTALMTQLDGRCEVRSSPRGTRVTLCFPAPLGGDAPADRLPMAGARHVLLVDDAARAGRLQEWLEAEGCTVARARAGDALAPIVTTRPGLTFIVTGDTRPQATALARQARAAGHSGRMVALVEADRPDARALRVAGFDGHLALPVDRERLRRELADDH